MGISRYPNITMAAHALWFAALCVAAAMAAVSHEELLQAYTRLQDEHRALKSTIQSMDPSENELLTVLAHKTRLGDGNGATSKWNFQNCTMYSAAPNISPDGQVVYEDCSSTACLSAAVTSPPHHGGRDVPGAKCAACPFERPILWAHRPVHDIVFCKSAKKVEEQTEMLVSCNPRKVEDHQTKDVSCVKTGVSSVDHVSASFHNATINNQRRRSNMLVFNHKVACMVVKQVYCTKPPNRACATSKKVYFHKLMVNWIGMPSSGFTSTSLEQAYNEANGTMRRRRQKWNNADSWLVADRTTGSPKIMPKANQTCPPSIIHPEMCEAYWRESWPQLVKYHDTSGICSLVAQNA